MREIISDTSPIQYLHQARCLDLLPSLYEKLIIPVGVVHELERGRELGVDLPDLGSLSWIETREVSKEQLAILRLIPHLGRGEKEVLALAAGNPDVKVILDDSLARQHAKLLEIDMTGTLGVLLKAKQENHLDVVEPTLKRIEQLGFHLDPNTRSAVLKLAGELIEQLEDPT